MWRHYNGYYPLFFFILGQSLITTLGNILPLNDIWCYKNSGPLDSVFSSIFRRYNKNKIQRSGIWRSDLDPSYQIYNFASLGTTPVKCRLIPLFGKMIFNFWLKSLLNHIGQERQYLITIPVLLHLQQIDRVKCVTSKILACLGFWVSYFI